MDVEGLVQRVKHNCNISDAKFWGNYSICGLLMRMRELYQSEHSLMPWDPVPTERITAWMQDRERLWHEMEADEFEDIIFKAKTFSPFDVEGLNLDLRDEGLIYGCGYGTFLKPTFFIAPLTKTDDILDYRIYHTRNELCRDLSASPAMSQGRCIYIRMDLVRIIMWERFQVMRSRKHRGLLDEMFAQYGIGRDDGPSDDYTGKTEALLSDMAAVFVRHEIGEIFEDERADAWLSLLHDADDKQSELYLRAVKDLLSDTSQCGPLKEIISGRDSRLLYVYMSFLDGLRRELFPEILNAFQSYAENGEWATIERARETGYRKAVVMRDICLKLHGEGHGMKKIVPSVKEYLAGVFPSY